jgi:hypothetical protein
VDLRDFQDKHFAIDPSFPSIKPLQLSRNCFDSHHNNLDELINNVMQQYDAYDADKINRVFLTLQSCLIEVMKIGGGNGYIIPHMYKDGLEHAGNLPTVLGCDRELYESVMQTLAV